MQGWTPDFIPKLTGDVVDARVIDQIIADRRSRRDALEPASWRRRRASSSASPPARRSPVRCRLRRGAEGSEHPLHAARHRRALPVSTPLFADMPVDMTEEEQAIALDAAGRRGGLRRVSVGAPGEPFVLGFRPHTYWRRWWRWPARRRLRRWSSGGRSCSPPATSGASITARPKGRRGRAGAGGPGAGRREGQRRTRSRAGMVEDLQGAGLAVRTAVVPSGTASLPDDLAEGGNPAGAFARMHAAEGELLSRRGRRRLRGRWAWRCAGSSSARAAGPDAGPPRRRRGAGLGRADESDGGRRWGRPGARIKPPGHGSGVAAP